MNKKNCKDGLDIYKKFITRMDRVSDFLKVAEDVGFDKDDIPDLSKVGRIKQQLVCSNRETIQKIKQNSPKHSCVFSVHTDIDKIKPEPPKLPKVILLQIVMVSTGTHFICEKS